MPPSIFNAVGAKTGVRRIKTRSDAESLSKTGTR